MEMVLAPPAAAYGLKQNMWSPAALDRPSTACADQSQVARALPRDYLTIVSNTDVRNAEAFAASEISADHFRSAAVFLTQSKPKQTQGSDVHAGTSFDQIYAQKFGEATPVPSMQLCIERRSGRSGGGGRPRILLQAVGRAAGGAVHHLHHQSQRLAALRDRPRQHHGVEERQRHQAPMPFTPRFPIQIRGAPA